MTQINADPAELAHFDGLSARWWDLDGPLRTLHEINPPRVAYVAQRSGGLGCLHVPRFIQPLAQLLLPLLLPPPILLLLLPVAPIRLITRNVCLW